MSDIASGSPALPMAGITVLDLSHVYNGPYATFLMAMAGATVVKIEPRQGEHLRKRDRNAGAGVPFAMLNANKESVTLDLKKPAGIALFREMVVKADVVVENFAPGVMARLGLAYDELKTLNPLIILASGSGYGQSGPYRDLPAMDLSVQAMSGVLGITGFPDGPPVKAGPAMGDFFGGVHLFAAIATALLHRERNGVGSAIDVAMMEAVYPSMSSNIGGLYSANKALPERTGNSHGGHSLCPYSVYVVRDGYVAIICSNDRHWRLLTEAMSRPDLAGDPRYATMVNRASRMAEVDALVADWCVGLTRDAAFDRLVAHGVPSAPVRRLKEVVADPHLRERGMLFEVDHPDFGTTVVCRSPLLISSAPQPPYRPSRRLGEDNEQVFTQHFALEPAAYERLVADGVI